MKGEVVRGLGPFDGARVSRRGYPGAGKGLGWGEREQEGFYRRGPRGAPGLVSGGGCLCPSRRAGLGEGSPAPRAAPPGLPRARAGAWSRGRRAGAAGLAAPLGTGAAGEWRVRQRVRQVRRCRRGLGRGRPEGDGENEAVVTGRDGSGDAGEDGGRRWRGGGGEGDPRQVTDGLWLGAGCRRGRGG